MTHNSNHSATLHKTEALTTPTRRLFLLTLFVFAGTYNVVSTK